MEFCYPTTGRKLVRGSTVSVDLSATATLKLSVQWGTADTDNTLTIDQVFSRWMPRRNVL